MVNEYIDIRERWGIILCYDLHRRDRKDMSAMMEAFGMREDDISDALDILLTEKNTGMCASNAGLRMSLIFIGQATSEEQFWDTICHEVYHAQQAICDYYDVKADSEDGAWTIGYLMRKVVMLLGEPCL